MSDIMDEISVEKIHGSGHYVLSAFVEDIGGVYSEPYLHSLQFYFYDWDEIDEMKSAYLQYMESNNMALWVEEED